MIPEINVFKCNGCGVCVDHCFYEVLHKIRKDGSA